MSRSHIDHCIYGLVHNLQRGTIHRRQWHSWKVHEHIQEMVMETVQMGEYVRTNETVGREAAIVVFADSEVIVSVIANAIR